MLDLKQVPRNRKHCNGGDGGVFFRPQKARGRAKFHSAPNFGAPGHEIYKK